MAEIENKQNKNEDTYSYKGWLVSDSIIKRSLAVVGHYWLGVLIIYVILGTILFILTLLAFLVAYFVKSLNLSFIFLS